MGTSTRRPPSRPDAQFRGGAHRPPGFDRRVADGWGAMGWPMRVLRAFLGCTFVFAGAQKLLDPNFLRPGGTDYVGRQLLGFAQGTPVAPMMDLLARHAVLAGYGVALLETAIGVAVLLGVLLPVAAFGGFLVNTVLFLSATWHVHPYFLGSDSIYAVAWLALLIETWPRPAPLEVRTRSRRAPAASTGVDRRVFLQVGAVAMLALGIDGIARAFRGPVPRADGLRAAAATPSRGPTPASPPPTQGGTVIASLDQLPVGRAVAFQDPQLGAAALVRLANDQVVAYSRICTHAGCLVGYNPSAELLVCPCHGAEFDPSRGAQPVAGPAPTPLQRIVVHVDVSSGNVLLG
jgi:thiosulfate dehydrogenase (quinone) large subunit